MKLSIDGKPHDSSGANVNEISVLELCRSNGVAVPALCFDSRVAPGGHCRACIVEVDGEVRAACTTLARDGMRVVTQSPQLHEYRRDLLALIESEASLSDGARDALRTSLLGESTDTTEPAAPRYPKLESSPAVEPATRADSSHAYLRIDLDACIKCRLCIRACGEIQGEFVFAMRGRGATSSVTWGGGDLADTDCVGCGACASVCPTSAISDVDRGRAPPGFGADERVVATTCAYCGVGCGLEVHASQGRVRYIDGAAGEPNDGHLCLKGRYAHEFVSSPDRLTTPLRRVNGRLVPITWEEAFALIAAEFARLEGGIAALSSSRCTNEENYLVQKWFRGGLHTHDVDCCARVCHAPSAAALRQGLGTGAATSSFADIERADLFLVAGSNTTESHPVVGARVKQAVLRGAQLIVIDPRRTELAALADVWLRPNPGTNVALLSSLAFVIVSENLIDAEFIAARTEGFSGFREGLRGCSPEETQHVTGVPAIQVRRAARLYAAATAPLQLHGLGMTEHFQGSEGVMCLVNLALLRGAVGRFGAGVNPLRGQNNVQGAADMGCQPDRLTGYARVDDAEVRARFERIWGRPLCGRIGRTIPQMYEAIDRGEIRGMYILGEDVAQTDPDASTVRARLTKLEFLVVQEIFLSETAKLAHLVLPGASFLEKEGTFTNAERRIRRVRKVLDPPGDARADWRILLDLMAATGFPQPFSSVEEVWDEVRAVAPAFAAATYDALRSSGLQWPVTSEAPEGTPILHRSTFARGRAEFQCVEYQPSPNEVSAIFPLVLVTGRVLEHYNSGSMTRRTRNSRIVERDLLDIHPRDAAARNVEDGASVVVASRFGEARVQARITEDVAPGVVFLSFHYPESGTNLVTSDVVDRITDCPEYKRTAVEVRRVS